MTHRRISSSNIRRQLSRILDEARFRGVHYIITRGDRTMAVLVGVEEYEEKFGSLPDLEGEKEGDGQTELELTPSPKGRAS